MVLRCSPADFASVISPSRFQLADILRSNLGQTRRTSAARVATIGSPVLRWNGTDDEAAKYSEHSRNFGV